MRWRWPLGLATGLITGILLVTTIVLWGMSGFENPVHDWRLDENAELGDARVLATEVTSVRINNRHLIRVTYEWQGTDGPRQGRSYVRTHRFEVGNVYTMEYWAKDPSVNRLKGSSASQSTLWLPTLLLGLALPLMAFLWWLRGVLAMRTTLRDGQATTARILAAHKTKSVNPPQVKVRFSFKEHHGQTIEGSQWVRPASELGQALLAGAAEAPVVYDERQPKRHRLVSREHFV